MSRLGLNVCPLFMACSLFGDARYRKVSLYSQCRSRLLVPVHKEIEQIETKSDNFVDDFPDPAESRNRSLCLQDFTSNANIYYMETILIQWSDRRLSAVLEVSEELRLSPQHKKCRKLRIWSHLLKKSLLKNYIFCTVSSPPIVLFGAFWERSKCTWSH